MVLLYHSMSGLVKCFHKNLIKKDRTRHSPRSSAPPVRAAKKIRQKVEICGKKGYDKHISHLKSVPQILTTKDIMYGNAGTALSPARNTQSTQNAPYAALSTHGALRAAICRSRSLNAQKSARAPVCFAANISCRNI